MVTIANVNAELWVFPFGSDGWFWDSRYYRCRSRRLRWEYWHRIFLCFRWWRKYSGRCCRDLLMIRRRANDCSTQIFWRRMAGSLNRLGRGYGYIAIAAIDVAIWDLYSKRLGMPLYEALVGPHERCRYMGLAVLAMQDPDSAVERSGICRYGLHGNKTAVADNRLESDTRCGRCAS